MKKNYNWHSRTVLAAVAFTSILFTACHFDSDKDYKRDEAEVAVDSARSVEHGQEQHEQSNPPVDAAKPNEGTQNASPSTSHDSSMRKDSTRGDKSSADVRYRKGRATLSEWSTDNTAKKEMDKEGIYVNTDVLPEYPGGKQAIQKYIEDNIQYPQAAINDDIEGTVRITFAIDETGKVYKATASGKNIGYGLEQEALRVVNKMPRWKPGVVNGKPVKARLSLPVVFLIS